MFHSFEPRPVASLGVELVSGYRLKSYAIRLADQVFDRARFDDGWDLARAALPQPSASADRPGVGFAIMHQGRTGDYLILAWWDRENELPLRVFVRDADGWRPARDGESVCVWDLEIIWRERCSYIDTVLTPSVASPLEAYLRRAATE